MLVLIISETDHLEIRNSAISLVDKILKYFATSKYTEQYLANSKH